MTANTGMHSLAKRNTGVMTRHEDKEWCNNVNQKKSMTRKDLVKISDRERTMISDIQVSEKKRGSVWISPFLIVKEPLEMLHPTLVGNIFSIKVEKKDQIIWEGYHIYIGSVLHFVAVNDLDIWAEINCPEFQLLA